MTDYTHFNHCQDHNEKSLLQLQFLIYSNQNSEIPVSLNTFLFLQLPKAYQGSSNWEMCVPYPYSELRDGKLRKSYSELRH